jgi:hypothetical protein
MGGRRGILLGEDGDDGVAALWSSIWDGVVAARNSAAAFGERRSVRALLPEAIAVRDLNGSTGSMVKAGSKEGSPS